MAKYEGSVSISAVHAAYRGGVAAVDVVEAVYERIESVRDNPVWIALVPRVQAHARASSLPRYSADLPLYGVPFAVKDNIDVAGVPTTAGCPGYAYAPSRSATVVERLEAAGAVCVGKTNMDQFATGLVGTRSPYGACRNAFDARYISGGSSSGSALAVALGQVAFALGTDTAGSGRIPAAFGNIVGLKPTPGLISTRGVVPACRSLDCVSIFARDCSEAARVLNVAAAFDADDPFSRRDQTPRPLAARPVFGVPPAAQLEFFGDREYASLYLAGVERLRGLGLDAVEVDFAPFLEARAMLYEGPWLAERVVAIGDFVGRHPEQVDPAVRAVLAAAADYSATAAFAAMHRLASLRRELEPLWERVACVLLPAAPTIYRIDEVEREPLELNTRLGCYTNFANLLELAAVNVPGGWRCDGLPFGLSLVSGALTDRALVHLGARLHAALEENDGELQRSPNQFTTTETSGGKR